VNQGLSTVQSATSKNASRLVRSPVR